MSEVVAFRYAKVFYLQAEEKKEFNQANEDMEVLKNLFKISKDISEKILLPKNLALDDKIKILEKLIKRNFHKITLNFLHFLDHKKRLNYLKEIVNFFYEIKKEKENLLDVKITKSSEFSSEFEEELKKKLQKKYHKEVILSSDIDESLIGGFSLQIEDDFFDLSIKGKIAAYKKHLTNL